MNNNKSNKVFKSQPKGKKPQRRSSKPKSFGNSRKFNEDDRVSDFAQKSSSAYNDISWYSRNSQLLRDSANLPMNTQIGNKLYPNKIGNSGSSDAVPGVMTIKYIPCFGISESDNNHSPLDVALTNIYSFVRHANSGSANYDRVDMGLYLICADSCFMYYNWMKRIYGIAMTFNGFNRYIPQALIDGNYVDYNDILVNLNDLRAFMNQFALRCDCLWIPSNMPLFIRHSWMCSNVYKDAENDRAQLYEFVPEGFYKYNELDSKTGGFAEFQMLRDMYDAPMTYNNIVELGNQLINAMLDSEDIGIIAGDIRKAYGANNLFTVAVTDESYSVEPVYNSEVLMQIENSNAFGAFSTSAQAGLFDITQDVDNQSLIFNPECQILRYSAPLCTQKVFLNFHHDNVTPEDVMVATRLTVQYESTSPIMGGHTNILACGSEIVTEYTVYYNEFTSQGRDLKSFDFTTYNGGDAATVDPNLVHRLSVFRSCPVHYFCRLVSPGTTGQPYSMTIPGYPAIEVDNFTFVEENTLLNLHTTALFSELGVPIN